MAKKKIAKSKSVKGRISKPESAKQRSKPRGQNLHVARLQKKLRKISAHIKKCKEDLQSIIRLKQIQSQIGR
ncbi:TPA: hypothetical protein HA238_04760 [Candidatus Micrarchaeota archaeon]|nr:hypothetical protein [Candidatus Micrarchaeota archaeon]